MVWSVYFVCCRCEDEVEETGCDSSHCRRDKEDRGKARIGGREDSHHRKGHQLLEAPVRGLGVDHGPM
ncbi:unnamed protein product, partial [Ectocarpus sp. 8 AP-2014]